MEKRAVLTEEEKVAHSVESLETAQFEVKFGRRLSMNGLFWKMMIFFITSCYFKLIITKLNEKSADV